MELFAWMIRRWLAALTRGSATTTAPASPDDLERSPAAAGSEVGAPAPQPVTGAGEPKWLQLARADLGIREVPGPEANPAIMRAWQYVDYDPPEGDETAWCSAKACEWMERAGIPSTRAPNARSWLKWGHELKTPRLGCIAVFWRGSPGGWQGHVALYAGAGDRPGTVKCLGGNQGNAVSLQDYPVAQLLGYRWPTTGGNSRTLRAQAAGMVGDAVTLGALAGGAIIESLPDALAIGAGVQSLAAYWPWAGAIGIAISIAARLVTIYARLSDWKAKGV
jgi:uncharacterized protein (TIGR02594 family)